MLFTALQLCGLVLIFVGALMLAGVPGALIAGGIGAVYIGLAGET